MSAVTQEMFDAAELAGKWSGDELAYKLYTIPRAEIHEESTEADAYYLVGLDAGSVRRVDELLDTAYGQRIGRDARRALEAALEGAPDDARTILSEMIK